MDACNNTVISFWGPAYLGAVLAWGSVSTFVLNYFSSRNSSGRFLSHHFAAQRRSTSSFSWAVHGDISEKFWEAILQNIRKFEELHFDGWRSFFGEVKLDSKKTTSKNTKGGDLFPQKSSRKKNGAPNWQKIHPTNGKNFELEMSSFDRSKQEKHPAGYLNHEIPGCLMRSFFHALLWSPHNWIVEIAF